VEETRRDSPSLKVGSKMCKSILQGEGKRNKSNSQRVVLSKELISLSWEETKSIEL